ncbi:alanine racemase, partial [Streptomyces sp. NBRC 14336]
RGGQPGVGGAGSRRVTVAAACVASGSSVGRLACGVVSRESVGPVPGV